MKILFSGFLLALMTCVWAGSRPAQGQTQQTAEAPLTNAAVIKLVRAGFKDKTVITLIRTRPTQFDLSPDRLIELKKSGVSENVILSMLAHQDAASIASDAWSDDPFFNEEDNSSGPKKENKADGSSADIFGSSGGSSGRTRSRIGNGASDNETQTTGSATVRILRPPTEAGGAPPKLERTPTLTNESIIELVKAGFSEGTIIRRIEQSPADFNLSPAKLIELRRHRVSEPVIAAMSAAMSDDSTSEEGKRQK